jgi:hypothetical protein
MKVEVEEVWEVAEVEEESILLPSTFLYFP